ncbi:methyl-accepting chemotaxis protein [Vibrio rhizosphaerae]|uniref:Methyl-accepting chemotaxis protein n=2 Tax=Vibrio rhizosphaerae TaxID=398736 RepID=A0ABU4IUB5_9VIBR|nr:methyl-accepting chemotaxis protein [Vibrio rhizosphaerae]MDW6092987.1 methyl-accepting chemotaxis protein [Vibrio rhizosphaerae]
MMTIITAYFSVKSVIGDYINQSYDSRMVSNVSLISSEIRQSIEREISVIESLDFGIIGIRDTKQKLGYEQVVKLINKTALSDKGSLDKAQSQYYIDLARDHADGIKITQVFSDSGQAKVIISKKKNGVVDFFTINLGLIGELIERYSVPGVYFELLDEQENSIYSTGKSNLALTQVDTITVAGSHWYLRSYIDYGYVNQIIDKINQDITKYLSLCAFMMLAISLIILNVQLNPLSKLKKLVENLSGSDADLTQRINLNRQDEIGDISNSVNCFIDNLQALFKNISGSNQALNEARAALDVQVGRNIASVASYNKQSENLSQAISDIRQSSLDIQQQTRQAMALAEQVSHQVSHAADKGVVAENMVIALDENTQKISSSIDVMETVSQGISSILSSIQKIADQTDLLALNASIEAARAGESGKGFAVVAEEVRALASKTRSSTIEIDQFLIQFSNSSDQITGQMSQVQKSSELSRNSTLEVIEQIQLVEKAVDEINTINSCISKASDSQCAMMETLNSEIEHSDALSEDITRSANEIASVQGDIRRVSSALTKDVAIFKV